MATSGVTAFSNTARDFVKQAMVRCKAMESGGVPTAEEMADGIFQINSILKFWQSKDVGLWRETGGTLTIPANDASGALPSGIRDVIDARYQVSATNERQMTRIERAEYFRPPNKEQSGAPTLFYISRQRGAVTMYVWPVPTAETTCKLEYDRIVETVTGETQEVDIPEEYTDVLVTVLAARLSGIFGDTDPVLFNEAKQAETAMFDADRPESYFMGAA